VGFQSSHIQLDVVPTRTILPHGKLGLCDWTEVINQKYSCVKVSIRWPWQKAEEQYLSLLIGYKRQDLSQQFV